MIVITVARKPLPGSVATTCLMHGTGALNIGAARIEVGGAQLTGGTSKLWSHYRDDREAKVPTWLPAQGGRWPPNLILQHLSECSTGGTTSVKVGKSGELGTRPGGFGDVGAGKGSSRPNAPQYGDASGVEEVAIWDCVVGCPVAGLDGQHGLTGGALRVTQEDAGRVDETQWRFKPTEGTVRDFGDRGLVSRYFKAVQED